MAASPTPAGGIGAILAAGDRDYLVRNSGEQVKISSIEGDTVAIYFSASWCPPCQEFTPKLIEAYKELASHGKRFEVVFVSGDVNEESFNAYFAKMPWLAVPFSDSKGRTGLNERYEVTGIPHLVFLDAKTGEVLTDEGVEVVEEYGVEAYPFTAERINELKEQEKAAKQVVDISDEDDDAGDEDEEGGGDDDDDDDDDDEDDDEEDDEADGEEDPEEELGTEYLVQPLGRAEDEEHASDFEPEENGDGAEDEEIDVDDDAEDGEDSVKAQSSSKRKRSGGEDNDGDDDDDGDDDEGPPSKR